MNSIEKLSKGLSNKLGDRLEKTDEERAVLNYGLFIIIHTLVSVFITLTIGFILGLFIEVSIIAFSSSMMKRYSGGVHASTPGRCSAIGVILATSLGILCKYLVNNLDSIGIIMILIIGFSLCYFGLYKKCPVPSKNKPMKKESTRKRLRKKAFNLMNTYILIVLLLYLVLIRYNVYYIKTIIIAILLGSLMQVISLSSIGENIILGLDKLLVKMPLLK